jgi:hypothetical protein
MSGSVNFGKSRPAHNSDHYDRCDNVLVRMQRVKVTGQNKQVA